MRPSAAYGVALAAAAVALVARWLLDPFLGDHLPFVTFFVAVAAAAWVGGWRPALLATGLGFALAWYFFVPHRFSFALKDTPATVGLAMYLMVSLAFAGFGEAMRLAQRRAEQRREALRTTLASIGDGVITTDAQGRVTSLNAVAESLTGWATAEAVGRPLDAVFRIVSEETRQPVENPATRALEQGVIVGLANHTVLIAKDGTERPIDDSAAPIRCQAGELVGCVLVFRDVTERRRLEKDRVSRLAAARLLASIVESSGDAIISKSLDGTIRTWNAAAERLFGYTAEQAVGRPIMMLIPAERAHEEERIIARLRAGERVEHFDTVRRRRDGRLVPVALTISPIRDEAGRVVGASKIVRDITDRTQAEEALRESEARKSAVVDTALDGIVTIDRDGKVIEFNPAAERTFGYRRADVLGREMAELIIPPGLRDSHRQGMARFLETGEGPILGQHLELTAVRSDGTEFPVEVAITRITTDGPPLFTGFVRDITDRKQADEKLRESERLRRFVMDSMPQKIFTATPAGGVDYFNPVWTQFTGLSFEQIRDWGWTQSIHPDDVGENVRVWRHSIDTGAPFEFEHRLRRHDGEYRWHISRALPMRDADGRIVMWIGANTDIHEQRQTTEDLRKLTAELSDADRRKNEFLAMLAHELRNPLAPIRNAVQVLRLTGSSREAVQSATEMLERQVDQMVRLVDDLLDVSRVSRGKIELRRRRVELQSVVSHAVEAARALAQCREHELTVAVPPEPVYLNADPTRLAQVVGNLLNNACKFTERGGRVRLAVERNGTHAVIRVRDTGIGIAADHLPRLFDLFVQVDTSLERSSSGLGIGLTLVKNLVELHGGTVEAHSAGVGQGSEFVVRLPMEVEPAPPPEPAGAAPTPPTIRRILVVDDNRDSAESLATLLQLSGHETHTAYDGQAAVEAAAALRPDAVVLDIGLPKLNGYEAARRIREQPWGMNLVLVALTGWGQEEDRQRAREAGFDGHMVKPMDYAALMKLLAEVQTAKG